MVEVTTTSAEATAENAPYVYNPGWQFTAVVVVLCILINATLPLWLMVGDYCTKKKRKEEPRRRRQRSGRGVEAVATGEEEVEVEFKSHDHDSDNSSSNDQDGPVGKRVHKKKNRSTTGSSDDDDNVSVASSTMVSEVAMAVLNARPKRIPGGGTPTTNQHLPQQHQQQPHPKEPKRHHHHLNKTKTYRGGKRDNHKGHEHHLQAAAVSRPYYYNYYNSSSKDDDDNDNDEDESRSAYGSSLSVLDADDVSVRDAVDDPSKRAATVIQDALDNDGNADDDDDNDGCCHQGWRRVLEIAEWDQEMKKFVSLAIPFVLQGLSGEFFEIVDVALIGHFVGQTEQNAYVTVALLMEFTSTLTTGFSECVGVLVPHADGAGNDLLVGRYLQLGFIFFTILTIPGIVIWGLLTYDAVLWFGFDEETAEIGQQYAYTLLGYLFLEGVDDCLEEFLNTLDHEKYTTIFSVTESCLHTAMILLMVTVFGVKDLVVIGLAQVAFSTIALVIDLVIIYRKGWFDDYWEGIFLTCGLRDRRAVRTVFATAIPLGVAWLLTYGEWEMMTFFAVGMGPNAVVVWTLLGYVWSCFETITDGLGDATEVRVGFRMGAGQVKKARSVSEKGIYVGIIVSVFNAGLLFIIAGHLPAWLTPDTALQELIFQTLPLVGFGQILMVAGMVAWAIIGAQGRVHLATAVEFVISWGFAVPAAAIFVFVFGYNLEGMVAALVIAYTIGANIYLYIYAKSDWEALSAKVVANNAAEFVGYDEFDWDDLPDEIRAAATILGYTVDLWDNDKEPPSSEKDWAELTREEQKAASLLGFNRKKWERDSNSSDDGEESNSDNKLPYDDCDWSELPDEVAKSAKLLGYTKHIWDSDGTAPLEEKDWKDLTPEEQAAAVVLGYDESKWNRDEDGESGDGSNAEVKLYSDAEWSDLPKDVKKAAEVLGYNRSLWNSNKDPPSASKEWKELLSAEQIAAAMLGYDEEKWNADDEEQENASIDEKNEETKKYEDYDWIDLPRSIRRAAKVLKYDQRLWEENKDPPTADKSWNRLTSDEQEAAIILGYNEKRWNADETEKMPSGATFNKSSSNKASAVVDSTFSDSNPSVLSIGSDPLSFINSIAQSVFSFDSAESFRSAQEPASPLNVGTTVEKSKPSAEPEDSKTDVVNYDDYSWRRLPPNIKEAAIVLGYTKKIWDNDGSPSSDDKDWAELSEAEQTAAKLLGYDAAKWDNDDDDDDDDEDA